MQAGLLSREMGESGVPTPLELAEGNTVHGAIREPWSGPARSKNLGMYGISMRENREIPWPPRWADHRAGRSGKAEAARLR